MKLGVLTVMMSDKSLEDALDYFATAGLDAVELGVGGYPGDAHVPVDELLSSAEKRKEFLAKIKSRGLEISALSVHGNALHPDKDFARDHHEQFVKAVNLANALNVKTVVTFSGCPGDSESSKYPNWVTCAWPPDYQTILKWQWEKKVIPYWSKQSAFAKKQGVRVAFEMHPGFVVYNTESMLKLRKSCGNNLGANFDPSHLFWQGMDPCVCVRALGKAIYHVHAKDTKIYAANTARNGVLDTKSFVDEANRSWLFRTVGFGHGRDFWCDFVSTLRMVGYDGVLSIEHEDSLMSANEGFMKAVTFLQDVIISQKAGEAYWA